MFWEKIITGIKIAEFDADLEPVEKIMRHM
jgi:hypothetical protein